MRVIKILSAALIGFAAFIGVSVNAQQVPVSCVWTLVSSDGPPSGATRYIVLQCKESNGNQIATRNLVWTQAANGYTSCTISTAPSISWTGDCMSPSFYRTIVASSSAQSSSSAPSCNSGAYIGSGCANSMTASPGFGAAVQQVCGAGCPVRYENFGATNGCWTQSPYLKAYCK